MIKKGLIIAAGNGSRLQRKEGDIPKPLRKVAGLKLIERIILSAKRGGISEFVIVVGYKKEKIIQGLNAERLGVKITFVENPDWQKSNGLSVLAARSHIKENFVLLMSDHIFDYRILKRFREAPLGNNRALLAVDYQLDSIYDMADATKVRVKENKIAAIGKSLKDYNAVDIGMFVATPYLFDALEEVKNKEGNCSLSDGIQLLAQREQMGTYNIGKGYWQDVDTKPALKHAEKMLFNACRKPTDGFISRNFNRHISLFISRLLIKTNLSANHVTGLTFLVGILSGIFVARGDYWNVLLGTFLFKLSSILDGCDGEISKLKLSDSKLGQWLDTISDNLTYVFFIVGLIFGLARQGDPWIAVTGTMTLFGLAMTLLVMFIYLVRHTNSGSLLSIQKDFQKTRGGFLKRFLSNIQFMIKRDFFSLLFLFLAILGELKLILWICLIGSNIAWMVLLQTRMGLFKPSVVTKESADPASLGDR